MSCEEPDLHGQQQEEVVEEAPPGYSGNGEIIRDNEFWYMDGSVVLVAGETAFRVHQGVLAQNSDVFRDLFTVPQPANHEKIDDCPVVHLFDLPEELRHLLRVLYMGRRYFRADVRIKFSIVSAVMRLAEKYQIEDLRDDALARMKSWFTDDFSVWSDLTKFDGNAAIQCEPSDAIEAVNLARHTQTDSMLPAALYLCCQLPTRLLLQGVTRADGSVERLSQEDQERCFDARSRLVLRRLTANDCIYSLDVCDACKDNSACKAELGTMSAVVNEEDVCREVYDYSVLHSSRPYIEARSSLCQECRDFVKSRDLEERRKIWNKLPQYTGVTVPDWGRSTFKSSQHI
ncbi:hypothetical protein AcV5_000067 [Taiwanofungus camphoratus]|nr:hypothetical protein AcV5_000067 [Antrodia cinnamomea]